MLHDRASVIAGHAACDMIEPVLLQVKPHATW